jgi:DUF1680 family protein
MRGPLLYCIEGIDNPGIDPRDLVLPESSTLSCMYHNDLLGGVVVLRGAAYAVLPGSHWHRALYRTVGAPAAMPEGKPTEVTAVPYYAWANRAPGPMQVWLRTAVA